MSDLEDLPLHSPSTTEDDEGKPVNYTTYNFTSLDQIDLSSELAAQYSSARTLLSMVESSNATPANQKAQVINTLTNLGTQIVKLQQEVYSIQRLRALEEALITVLRTLPEDAQQAFYATYEAALARSAT